MIQVIMVKGSRTNLIDLAIMAWTGSIYSHCGFLLNGEVVVQVTRIGRHTVPLSDYPWDHDIYDIQGTDEFRGKLKDLVLVKASEPNKRYDYLAILSITLRGLIGFRSSLNIPGAETCSEFAGKQAATCGFRWSKPTSALTPQDIMSEGLIYEHRYRRPS